MWLSNQHSLYNQAVWQMKKDALYAWLLDNGTVSLCHFTGNSAKNGGFDLRL